MTQTTDENIEQRLPSVLLDYLWHMIQCSEQFQEKDFNILLETKDLNGRQIQDIIIQKDENWIRRRVFGFDPVTALIHVFCKQNHIEMALSEMQPI